MANDDMQNARKLKTSLATSLCSYVAVYKNMDDLNKDISKYNNINYSIIFVGTSAYVVKKEDFGANFNLSISSGKLYANNKSVSPTITGVNQKDLVISGGMSAYLNNYTGIK